MTHPTRSRQLNSHPMRSDGRCIIYLMSRDVRTHAHPALAHAQALALETHLPLLVVFHLYPRPGVRSRQQIMYMLEGLREVESELRSHNIPLSIVHHRTVAELVGTLEHEYRPAAWVLDYSPLRAGRTRRAQIAELSSTAVHEVDAHNIIPAWILSDHEEYSAATLRPKIKRLLHTYLAPPPDIITHPYTLDPHLVPVDWTTVMSAITAHTLSDYTIESRPGHSEATRVLHDFIAHRYQHYDRDRNDPTLDGQSHLSPHLHYGMISPVEIVRACMASDHDLMTEHYNGIYDLRSPSVKMLENHFLEELIVRRELAENYCTYCPHYDSIDGARDWARSTLESTRSDTRSYLYTYDQLLSSLTHDELWNAAQTQLTRTGRIHGYLRMYWAKKILEWTPDPETALAHAIRLNDTYQLDGLDPNGYTGIMWSICGIHDRPWFARPIYGTIRMMTLSGISRKFPIQRYIDLYSSPNHSSRDMTLF